MTQRDEQKTDCRARILASAGRGFRSHGYGGLGVDGLARDAGVTSGAFYAHFKSKAAAFREAVVAGMLQVRSGIEHLRIAHGAGWRRAFVDMYMGERRRMELSQSCALQSLTTEVARAGSEARHAFERELDTVIATAAAGLSAGTLRERRADAIALLAILSGGVSLARAVEEPALADEIADAVREAALRMERPAAAVS